MSHRPVAPLPPARRAGLRALVLGLGLATVLPLAAPPAGAAESSRRPAGTAAPDAVAETSARVAEAQRQVAAMREQAERTAAVLAEGTTRLEAHQDQLSRLQGEQAVAEQAAREALARAAEAKAFLAVVVSTAYRSPVPQTVHMALTARPDQIVDVIEARADLNRVQGGSQDALRRATAARAEADQAVEHAEVLTVQARQAEQAVAAEVEQLRAVALQSEQSLAAAATVLAAAQADNQSAALAAAAEQARVRDAEQAARAAAGSFLVATCGGQPAGQEGNGLLSPASLCPLDDAPGHALRPDAAAAFNAMNAAHKAQLGRPLCVTDSYRSYAAQVDVYARKPQLAAVPGRSNHGWGLAVDYGCGAERFGTPEHEWLRANAGAFGWFHPSWAQPGGSRPEPWHWEFATAK